MCAPTVSAAGAQPVPSDLPAPDVQRGFVSLRSVGSARRGPTASLRGIEGTYGRPAPSAFPAIADYAVLSDCENTCLVAPGGAVEWLCLPRPHDSSVFGTLLDRSAGSFRLGPADAQV